MDLTGIFSKKDQWNRGLFLSFDLSPASFFESELLPKIIVEENLTVVVDEANRPIPSKMKENKENKIL